MSSATLSNRGKRKSSGSSLTTNGVRLYGGAAPSQEYEACIGIDSPSSEDHTSFAQQHQQFQQPATTTQYMTANGQLLAQQQQQVYNGISPNFPAQTHNGHHPTFTQPPLQQPLYGGGIMSYDSQQNLYALNHHHYNVQPSPVPQLAPSPAASIPTTSEEEDERKQHEQMLRFIEQQQLSQLNNGGVNQTPSEAAALASSISQASAQQYQAYLQQTQTREFQELLQEANSTHENRLFASVKNRKQKRRLANVFVRMSNTLETFAKQIETSGANVSERSKQVTVQELDRNLAEMWTILTSSGMIFGVCLLFLGIPGLCILLASLIAALFCQTTTRAQANMIVKWILPLTRRMTLTLSKSTSGSIRASAKSIRFFGVGKKSKKDNELEGMEDVDVILSQIKAENALNM